MGGFEILTRNQKLKNGSLKKICGPTFKFVDCWLRKDEWMNKIKFAEKF